MHLQQPVILGSFVAVAALSVAARWREIDLEDSRLEDVSLREIERERGVAGS